MGAGLTDDGDPAVVVLLESEGVAVPNTLDDFPVVTVVTGKIHSLAPPAAQASFTFSCAGLSCTFDGSGSSGRRLSFDWDFGDESDGTGKIVNHTYGGDGTYTVTLLVTDKVGNTDTTSEDVTVSDGGVPPPPPPPPGLPDCHATNQRLVKCAVPFPIDVSAGHPDITAGTSGARVVDGLGVTYAFSNNHVYANENLASIGDDALQPGPFDGGVNPDDAFGTLTAYKPLVFLPFCCNDFDGAIVQTDDISNRTTDAGYGIPGSNVQAAYTGQRLQKCGRTTGCTKFRVYGTGFTVDVGYGSGTARFVNQIVVIGGGVSAGGDSGSLVVQRGKGNPAVGLLFAGSVNSTIISPVGPALSHFGVSIDGK